MSAATQEQRRRYIAKIAQMCDLMDDLRIGVVLSFAETCVIESSLEAAAEKRNATIGRVLPFACRPDDLA